MKHHFITFLSLLCTPILHAMEVPPLDFPAKVAVTMHVYEKHHYPLDYNPNMPILPCYSDSRFETEEWPISEWTSSAHYDAQQGGYVPGNPQPIKRLRFSFIDFTFRLEIHNISNNCVHATCDVKPLIANGEFHGIDNLKITFLPDATHSYKLPWFSNYYLKVNATREGTIIPNKPLVDLKTKNTKSD